jgi:hypothetical protein
MLRERFDEIDSQERMSKPKIDLKARLGRRPGATPASASIPPPVGVNPPQSSGAPGHASGFPVSGGYASQQPQMRGSFDPMGSVPVVSAAPVRISGASGLEMDAEFAAVHKSGRTKVIILAAATAVVGGVLGFAVGGMNERNAVAEAAVIGAKSLSVEIDAANAAVTKLSEVVTSAAKSLKDGKYPDNEVKELGSLNIPFDGTNLSGKSIGRFKPQLLTMLVNYAESASKVNNQKDRLRGLLSYSKVGVEELLAQNTNPRVHWGVSVQSGPQGPWGVMQVLPTAFPAKEAWPAAFEVQSGDQKLSVKRYAGGDPTRGPDGAQVIPIAPSTQNAVCPTDTIVRLRRELSDIQKLVTGDDTPGAEVTGIIQLGDTIKKQLAAIGG